MKTLKFLAAITIACCALTACVQEEEMIMPLDIESSVLLTPVEEVGTIDLLRDYIKVEDDIAQLNINSEGAEKLGVAPEYYDSIISSIEQANASVRKYKENDPELRIHWMFGDVQYSSLKNGYLPKYKESNVSVEPLSIPSDIIDGYGSNWSYSDVFFLDSRFNCFKCHAWASPPVSFYEIITVFNSAAEITIRISDPSNPGKDFYAPVAYNNTSGYVGFKPNAPSGYLAFAAYYVQYEGVIW